MKLLKIKCTVLVITLSISLFGLDAFAQQEKPPLFIKSGFWAPSFYIGSKQVPEGAFRKALQVNPEAYKMYKQGKALDITGAVMGGIGGFMVGYDLGTRIAGKDGNNTLLFSGSAVTIGGLVINLIGAKKRYKAARLYNSKYVGYLNLSLQVTGGGLSWEF